MTDGLLEGDVIFTVMIIARDIGNSMVDNERWHFRGDYHDLDNDCHHNSQRLLMNDGFSGRDFIFKIIGEHLLEKSP